MIEGASMAMGLSALKTMEWKSTSDRISDDLRQMIIEGQLVPGEQLGEARIAELLGVSRARSARRSSNWCRRSCWSPPGTRVSPS